ncbi:MAG TPA: glycosyltransferase [Gemmataceae bacterium]|nr:glycosyltransferase [Gemmataceae bacterium]
MHVYFDLRCLQDPCYAFRGVGFHAASIVRHARAHLPASARTVGILDESLEPLPPAYRDLVDVLQPTASPAQDRAPILFVQLSPMTHDPARMAPLLGRGRVLAYTVVYDFIPLAESRYLPTPAARRGYLNNLAWLKHYHTFFPISHATGRELRELLRVPAHRVEVIGAGLRQTFRSFTPAPDRPPRCRFLPGRYFLVVGGADPRKNIEVVIAAYGRLPLLTRNELGLLVVGNYGEGERERLTRLFVEQGGTPRQIEFLRDITDEELATLYHHALATVSASRWEGFSLPVVEAIACGCPVLASDVEAHRELVEQAGARFAPDDHERLSALMIEVIADPRRRPALLEQQWGVAARFAEDKVAARFWLRALRDYRARLAVPRPATLRKPRLAILTPYPPDRSGVADYTARSLPNLARHALLDVFTDARPDRPQPFVRRFEPITQLPYLIDEYDRVIAIVGNSHFHIKIVEHHCRFGGACLIHDNRLADFYMAARGPQQFAKLASRWLGRAVSTEEAESWIAPHTTLPSLFFEELLAPSDPLIVHSRGIQAEVQRQYGHTASYLPFCCLRQFAESELQDSARQEARRRLALPDGRVAIVSFGIVHPAKCAEESIWALENLLAWGIPADLYFLGTAGPFKNPLLQLAGRLGIAPHVHLVDDWISEQTYRDYLVAADFAIQLRTHCFGGLSGSVSDCISAGLPTVANEDLANAMDGPEFILRVPDHATPPLIAEQLAEGYARGLHHERLWPSRARYVRDHSFESYALQMMRVLGLN